MFTRITIINRCLEQLFRNAPAPPPSHGHPLQQWGKFMDTSSFSTGMTMVDWGCCTMVSFSWSRCQMCYSVVNNYLSAGRNRFDLESGPWTIRATRGKETLYPVPIKFADWRLKSTWFCPIVMSRLVGTCVADDAYLVQTRDISYFVATWWRGWFILVRHSNKKRDNVAKSRPGSNTADNTKSSPVLNFVNLPLTKKDRCCTAACIVSRAGQEYFECT